MKIFIVTAMIEPAATREFWSTWVERAEDPEALGRVVVVNGSKTIDLTQTWPYVYSHPDKGMQGTYLCSGQIMGPVPAFAWGVRVALERGADLVCCFHDDMSFLAQGWDRRLRNWFKDRPDCVLAGFGGGVKLGRPGMYDEEYDPMSLARHDFISNMRDADLHGKRVEYPWQVAVLDGFSLIFTKQFALYAWPKMQELGITHHAYDAYFGVLAEKYRRELADLSAQAVQPPPRVSVWMLPERVHHAGGRSAVGNQEYHAWAAKQIEGGDQGFWKESHRKVWEASRGILPLGWDTRGGGGA